MKKETAATETSTWLGFKGYVTYIWQESRQSYVLFFLFFPFFIVANFVQIYMPKLVVQELEQQQTVMHLGLSVLAVIFILIVSVSFREKILARIRFGNRKLVQKMSNASADKMLYVDYQYLEDREFLTLRNKTEENLFGGSIGDGNSDGVALDRFMERGVTSVAVVGNLAIYGYYLWRLSPWLILVLILTNSTMFFVNKHARQFENRYSEELSDVWQKLDYASRKAGDFSMAKDVRLYQMKEWISGLIDKYCKKRLYYKAKDMKIGIWDSTSFALISGIFYACFYFCLLYRLWNDNMAISDVVFYTGMGPAIYHMADYDIVQNIRAVIRISIAFRRFEVFMQYGEDTGKKDVPLQKEAPLLELKDVSFSYPDASEEVLKHFSLRVTPGEKIAIVGVNGAGKTTLMKLICGLLHPTEGAIYLNGKNMEEIEAEERYAHFSCAFQDIQFLPLSIRDNITGENIAMQESSTAKQDGSVDARVWECLRQAGVDKDVERLPEQLDSKMEKSVHDDAVDFSGGQKQKLLLARALYRDTGVLILDEPTASLDALAENEIYEKYAKFAEGKTSFFVSHRLSSTRFCDRIILIDGGEVAEQGSHEELLAQGGLYAKMFELQSHYYKGGEAV